MMRFLVALFGVAALASPALAKCDNNTGPCLIEGGDYVIALPDTDAANPPVVMFLHGAGGTGAQVMKNKKLVNSLVSRGYAVLAPTAQRKFGQGAGYVWNFYPGWEGRDENKFLDDVATDAARRFGLNRDRVLLAGFSAGAFMVNYLACDAPGTFAAYAPVAGGFWDPLPETCAGPIKLLQTHGWSDKTVPLEGRTLGGGRFQQGDIFVGLDIWRDANVCANENPKVISTEGTFWRRKWTGCAPESALEFAVFPGGHSMPVGWSDMVLDWFEAQVEVGG